MMPKHFLLLIAAVVPTLSCFGNNCDRSACESFGKAAASASIGQGIAGAISLESDQIADGCQICGLSEAGLDVWKAQAAVRDQAAACQLAETPAIESFTALGRYDHPLEPGEYLVCVSAKSSRPCIGVAVTAGKISTLNVKHTYGLSSVAVLEPGSAGLRSESFNCVASGS
jgi:hypothetical protein